MTHEVRDAEVQLLVAISGTLRADYPEDDLAWSGSPFAWIKTRPPRQKGAIGEKLVAGWCAAKDLDVTRPPNSECDRLIHGHRAEIKFSTLWKEGGYRFQQLRDQRYDFAVCLGVSPFDAHMWVIPKSVLIEGRGVLDGLAGQHLGRVGTDTAWLHVDPAAVPAWLSPYGGSLASAFRVLEGLVSG